MHELPRAALLFMEEGLRIPADGLFQLSLGCGVSRIWKRSVIDERLQGTQ